MSNMERTTAMESMLRESLASILTWYLRARGPRIFFNGLLVIFYDLP
jgi:hypothetical protein